jgi:hypothetical protein
MVGKHAFLFSLANSFSSVENSPPIVPNSRYSTGKRTTNHFRVYKSVGRGRE